MKVTSAAHQVCSTTAIELSEHSIESAKLSAPLFAEVTKQGWAIPTIATFRYSFDQKKFLYDIFMTGQDTGKKKSPEEVELLVRKNFASPKDYVTKSQIRALFSNFTKQLKDGTLEDPAEKLKKNPSTEIKWYILSRAHIYVPGSKMCDLCVSEKVLILYRISVLSNQQFKKIQQYWKNHLYNQ